MFSFSISEKLLKRVVIDGEFQEKKNINTSIEESRKQFHEVTSKEFQRCF